MATELRKFHLPTPLLILPPGIYQDSFIQPNVDPVYNHLLQKAAEKAEGELKPVQEVPVKQSEKDPKTDSGCVVS